MYGRLHSLRARLLFTAIVFLVLLAIALALLVAYGFRATQRTAAAQSVASLQAQGREALQTLIVREGQFSTLYFQQPAMASRTAAEYLSGMKQRKVVTPTRMSAQLVQNDAGYISDHNPARLSDLYIPSFVPLTSLETQRTIRDSAFLDVLAPTLLQQNAQAVALYYLGVNDISRYYPMGSIEGVPPDLRLTQESWFVLTAPAANPGQQTTWSPLYLDDAGNGLMITTCSPVYDGETFDGVVCLDVTLRAMTEHLERLRLTPNSYAFLTDANGQLIAGPPAAVQALTGYAAIPLPEGNNQTIGLSLRDPAIRAIIQHNQSDIQTIDLGGEPVFLATTRLTDLGWHLSLVAPIAEVTAQSSFVVGAIEQGTIATMRTTTLVMLLFFIFAVVGITLFSLRLTRPIATLVMATQAVARGELRTTIPVTSQDELGTLAESFNRMTHELRTARANLEQLVAERTDALNQSMRLQEEVVQQANMMLAMSTPLIPVSDQIIVMPLMGTINAERSQQVLRTLLDGVAGRRAKVAILDITGVSVVDTFVAEVLIQAAQAMRLLGASVILTGIRPEVAQMLVGLGVDLRGLITRSTLQSGIEHANGMLLKPVHRNGVNGVHTALDESGKREP